MTINRLILPLLFLYSILNSSAAISPWLLSGQTNTVYSRGDAYLSYDLYLGRNLLVDTDGFIEMTEHTSSPDTPASNKIRIYPKTDRKLYYKDDTGAEILSGGWDGSPIASGTITNLYLERINGLRHASMVSGSWWASGVGSNPGASSFLSPITTGAIASGTLSTPTDSTNFIWSAQLWKSSASANSGISGAATWAIVLHGGESVVMCLRFHNTNNIVARLGFHEHSGTSEGNDGLRFCLNAGFLTGEARASGTGTSTSSSYEVELEKDYWLQIDLAEDKSVATFTILSIPHLTQLWTDTVSANIPDTIVGEVTQFRMNIWHTGSSAINLMTIDEVGVIRSKLR